MIRLCVFPVLSQKNVFKTCSSFWEKPVWNLTPLVGSEKFRKVKNVFFFVDDRWSLTAQEEEEEEG